LTFQSLEPSTPWNTQKERRMNIGEAAKTSGLPTA
jgi:hypothetical protein